MEIPSSILAQLVYNLVRDNHAHADAVIIITHEHTATGMFPVFDTVSHLPREKINEYLTEYVAGEFADQLEGKQ